MVENSVRVSGGEGDAVILEVSFDRRFETQESTESATAKRRKELEQLQSHIETLQAELARVQVSLSSDLAIICGFYLKFFVTYKNLFKHFKYGHLNASFAVRPAHKFSMRRCTVE